MRLVFLAETASIWTLHVTARSYKSYRLSSFIQYGIAIVGCADCDGIPLCQWWIDGGGPVTRGQSVRRFQRLCFPLGGDFKLLEPEVLMGLSTVHVMHHDH